MKFLRNITAVMLLAGAPALAQEADTAQLEKGEALYRHWCAACHGIGPRHPGTQALEVMYGPDVPAALELRTDLYAETIEYFVRTGTSVMPFFRKTELSDDDLAAVSAWLTRNTPE